MDGRWLIFLDLIQPPVPENFYYPEKKIPINNSLVK
jgi:hypothetical protein